MIDLFMPCAITDYLNAAWFFDWFVNNASYILVFIFMMMRGNSDLTCGGIVCGFDPLNAKKPAAKNEVIAVRGLNVCSGSFPSAILDVVVAVGAERLAHEILSGRSLGRSLGQLRARHAHRTSDSVCFCQFSLRARMPHQ